MSNKFNQDLLNRKKAEFLGAVKLAAKVLELGYIPVVEFHEDKCPYDEGKEWAHIHLDTHIICVSKKRLIDMDFDQIKDTAIHEVTHCVDPTHDPSFHNKMEKLKIGTWRPRGAGFVIIDGRGSKESKPTKEKNISTYDVVSKVFNGYFNEAIGRGDKRKITGSINTGGRYTFYTTENNPLADVSDYFKNYRNNLTKEDYISYKELVEKTIKLEEFGYFHSEFEKLIEDYIDELDEFLELKGELKKSIEEFKKEEEDRLRKEAAKIARLAEEARKRELAEEEARKKRIEEEKKAEEERLKKAKEEEKKFKEEAKKAEKEHKKKKGKTPLIINYGLNIIDKNYKILPKANIIIKDGDDVLISDFTDSKGFIKVKLQEGQYEVEIKHGKESFQKSIEFNRKTPYMNIRADGLVEAKSRGFKKFALISIILLLILGGAYFYYNYYNIPEKIVDTLLIENQQEQVVEKPVISKSYDSLIQEILETSNYNDKEVSIMGKHSFAENSDYQGIIIDDKGYSISFKTQFSKGYNPSKIYIFKGIIQEENGEKYLNANLDISEKR